MELLTTLVLSAHLLTMNTASAGPLLCIWLRWRVVACGETTGDLGRRLAWWSVNSMLVGMFSGGLLFVTTPTNGLSLALGRFPASAYWFAVLELVFSLACMIGIATGWSFLNKWWLSLLAVASATNLLYHFPPMMAVIGQLATNPRWTNEAVIDRPVLLKLMTGGEVLALSFHFVLSSLAVSAIVVLHLVGRKLSNDSLNSEFQTISSRASGIALVATVLQVPVGIWLMTTLSAPARSALMGASPWAALSFLAAIAAAIVLMQRLLSVTLGEMERRSLRHVVALVCVVVLLMTMSLRLSRLNTLLSRAAIVTASSQAVRC